MTTMMHSNHLLLYIILAVALLLFIDLAYTLIFGKDLHKGAKVLYDGFVWTVVSYNAKKSIIERKGVQIHVRNKELRIYKD